MPNDSPEPTPIRCPSCAHVFTLHVRDMNPAPACPSCGATVHRSTLPAFAPPNPPAMPRTPNPPPRKKG